MDFRLGPESDQLRAEAKAFLTEYMTPERERHLYESGTSHDAGFTQLLKERGWYMPDWPAELGGQGRSSVEFEALDEELQRFDAPYYSVAMTAMIAKVIAKVGTPALQAEVLPRALDGTISIAFGFSEPEAGSDVAAAATKAVRDGDEWVINGQKMFTTNAHVSDYVFLLTRTNPDVAKHKGLTTFLCPLDHPGVEVQAVFTLSGERTNITFYNDVRLDDMWRVGDVDGGWATMTLALQDEHSNGYAGHTVRLLHHVEAWAREPGPDGARPIDDPDVRRRLGRVATEVEVAVLLQRRATWMAGNGDVPEAEGPMAKLFSSEQLERAAQDLFDLVGPDALRSRFTEGAPEDGQVEHLLRFSIGSTIYAGTSEIQRGIIAGRGLGLPRS